ncbi:MAG: hypothetical protein AAFP19_23250, partial [Bacteroidota bacterium]
MAFPFNGISLPQFLICSLLFLIVPALSATTFTDETDCPRKKKNCTGKRIFKDGSIYKGEFKYGQPDGWGELSWPNGDTYEGQFQDGLRHGKGELSYANGDYYEGEFRFGYMHGEGEYTWADGARYTGRFHEDLFHGKGLFVSSDQEVYDGEWRRGLLPSTKIKLPVPSASPRLHSPS